jgi:hypothetical protein
MTKVVSMFGDELPIEPVADVVRELRELLALAESGQLRAIGYITVKQDHVLGTGWTGEAGTRNALAAGVSVMQYRVAQSIHEGGYSQ